MKARDRERQRKKEIERGKKKRKVGRYGALPGRKKEKQTRKAKVYLPFSAIVHKRPFLTESFSYSSFIPGFC